MLVKKVNSCCCFDLRTGGFILGYMLLAAWFIFFVGVMIFSAYFSAALVLLFICNAIAFVYGMHKKNYKFMLPTVIWSFMNNVLSFFGMYCVTITIIFGSLKKPLPGDSTVIVFVWFICLIITLLIWYFTSVLWSLYNAMKNESLQFHSRSLSSAENGDSGAIQTTSELQIWPSLGL